MKRILVTGAAGYIGRHVVDSLIEQGNEVIAVDYNNAGINKKAKYLEYDIFSGSENIFKELNSPDICLHMAWKDGFIHNSTSHMENLSKHFVFIKNMIEGGLKHISIMGTMHEVGYIEGKIDENTPTNPVSMYGISKDSLRRSVFLLAESKADLILQWIRAYYIYGDDKNNNSIFAKILKAEEEGKDTFPFTTGKNKYDFIDVSELSKQITETILQNKINGIINCCTGTPISLAEKVENFIKEKKLKLKLEYGVFPDRKYDSPEIWGDNSKIKEIVGSSNLKW